MKKLVIGLMFVLFTNFLISQNETTESKFNYVVGLPKMTAVQLDFVKTDLLAFSQITSAEFNFHSGCLLIETDPQATKPLGYTDIETVLLNYFDHGDIFRKVVVSLSQLKAETAKDDKIIIK